MLNNACSERDNGTVVTCDHADPKKSFGLGTGEGNLCPNHSRPELRFHIPRASAPGGAAEPASEAVENNHHLEPPVGTF